MGRSDVLYARLAKVGLGVLGRYAKELKVRIRDHLREDVAKDLLCSMNRMMEEGYYRNLEDILALSRNGTWFGRTSVLSWSSTVSSCICTVGSSWRRCSRRRSGCASAS